MYNQRKRDHLRITLDEDVRSWSTTGLERYRLLHCALPEMALSDVDTQTTFLGRTLAAPILISAMTGGTAQGAEINRALAQAAQALGLAMVVGSQRVGIEHPSLMDTYIVRDVAPDILLLANLGAVQLNYGFGLEACRRAIEAIGADGLVLHLNPLQEALQPEGNTNFRGILDKIRTICQELEYPVIVKEVGWGLSAAVARDLYDAGVAALDIAGSGGTSWSQVERHRATSEQAACVAEAFKDWGIPTVESLCAVRAACPKTPVIASGGIRNGVEIALCLALGADMVGMAQALLEAATRSPQAITEQLSIIIQQLRIAMFCCGAQRIQDLGTARVVRRPM